MLNDTILEQLDSSYKFNCPIDLKPGQKDDFVDDFISFLSQSCTTQGAQSAREVGPTQEDKFPITPPDADPITPDTEIFSNLPQLLDENNKNNNDDAGSQQNLDDSFFSLELANPSSIDLW